MITQFKIFENTPIPPKQDRGEEIVYTLKTKAITYGDEVYEYTVNIITGNIDDEYNGLCLSIETTPGCWYLSTLLPSTRYYDKISISGNDWMCENWSDIMNELEEALPELKMIMTADKYNL